MKTFNPLFIILAAVTLSSCEPHGLEVKDNSFLFSARHQVDESTLHSKVTLTLEQGNAAQKYSIAYTIDEDPSLNLTDLDGTVESDRISVSFEDFPSHTWLLPVLDEGCHVLQFKIRSDSYSQNLDVPFEISVAPFKMHAEISTPASSTVTTLILNLVEGIADRDYTGCVYVDDEPATPERFAVNFSKTPTFMMEIPLVRPGEHVIKIEMNDGRRTETTTIRYDEPLRHPDLDVYINHHDQSGRTRIMVHDNPYGLTLSVKDSLFVKGKCTYTSADYPGYVSELTEFKESSGGVTLDTFVPVGGRYYDLVDKDSIEGKITSDGRQSTTWEEVWHTDSEGYWDYVRRNGPWVPFIITESRQEITAIFENLQGVTVHVHCTEPGCVFNGKALGDDEYTYKL